MIPATRKIGNEIVTSNGLEKGGAPLPAESTIELDGKHEFAAVFVHDVTGENYKYEFVVLF
jgi:hypothetical protein